MTRAPILFPLAIVAALAACTRSAPAPELAESIRLGREVYAFESCGSCHGGRREGGAKGPPLDSLRRHWSAEELSRYLRQPQQYRHDARLRRLAQRYPAGMAGLPAAPPDHLRNLVAFLLSP